MKEERISRVPQSGRSCQRSVLMVNKDPLLRSVFVPALQEAGYRVRTAEEAFESIRAIRAERPSLIVIDAALPGISGAFLAGYLRTWGVASKVLLITNGARDMTDGGHLPGVELIPKPKGVRAFVDAVEQAFADTAQESGLECCDTHALRFGWGSRLESPHVLLINQSRSPHVNEAKYFYALWLGGRAEIFRRRRQ